jgi:hypothetical protein
VHDNPEATETEQELAQTERQQEEDATRYPSHEDPDEAAERAGTNETE